MEKPSLMDSNIFYTRMICPVCAGHGCVECCHTGDQGCVPVECDYCLGKGELVEYNKKAFFCVGLLSMISAIAYIIFANK